MSEREISLKYESSLTVKGNGTVSETIKTPFGIDFKDIKQVFIDQSPDSIKMMSIYPNGCYVYTETHSDKALLRTNWPIQKDENGDLVITEPTE